MGGVGWGRVVWWYAPLRSAPRLEDLSRRVLPTIKSHREATHWVTACLPDSLSPLLAPQWQWRPTRAHMRRRLPSDEQGCHAHDCAGIVWARARARDGERPTDRSTASPWAVRPATGREGGWQGASLQTLRRSVGGFRIAPARLLCGHISRAVRTPVSRALGRRAEALRIAPR